MPKHSAQRTSPSRPYDVLFHMVIGKWITQALGTVVELGVPDQLAKEQGSAAILRGMPEYPRMASIDC